MSSNINRRSFLRNAGLTGTALALGFYVTSCKETAKPEPEGIIDLFKVNVDSEAKGMMLNPFVIIDEAGVVTIMAHKPEMGQGTYQSIPLLIAEELGVDPEKVVLKQAKGDAKYGNQGVGGSASVRTMWEPMRKTGAAAKAMLVAAAAAQWGVDPATCRTEDGKVIHPEQESLAFGSLVAAASKLKVPQEPELKSPKDFKYIGKVNLRKDIDQKVNGTANFGIDMKVPGMVYASVERSPSFNGKVTSFDDTKAMAVKGVQQVLKSERRLLKNSIEGVAVIADNYWAALKGRRALAINWAEQAPLDTEGIYTRMRTAGEQTGLEDTQQGDFGKAYEQVEEKITFDYETPFLAHAPMEPQNVLVDVRADVCEIWAPTQVPGWARSLVAEYLDIKPEKIIIHIPFLGGGFGRRLLSDFILEACFLSKAIKKPVKVVWTREDDMMQGPFRPGSLNRLSGGVDAKGNLLAMRHKVIAPAINASLFPDFDPTKVPRGIMEPLGEDFYDIPNYQTNYVFVDVDPIPLCWWRSVYSSTNVFGQECFIDEMAAAAKQDPVDFRLKLLAKNPRAKQVLEMLATKSNWKEALPDGKARGVAITHCFSSVCGHVVEVSKAEDGGVKIDKVTTVIDCGIAVNPDNVKAQTEGNIVMALTAALKDAIEFKAGKVVQTNFHNYRMMRMPEIPAIDIHIVPSAASPTGVGEPALPPLAPALCNAIFKLTGKRIQKLPFALDAV